MIAGPGRVGPGRLAGVGAGGALPRGGPGGAAVDQDLVDCASGARSGRLPAFSATRPDLECQPGAAGVADVDALPVVDVDHRSAVAVDERPVHRAVVDSDPLALVKAQDQVRTGDTRIGDPDISTQIAPHDDILTWREGTLRTVVPNGQYGRG